MLAMVALKIFRTFLWFFVFYTNIFSAFGYYLTIVHNNDVHAHFDQTNVRSGDCSPKDAEAGECYGGEARRVTVIENARRNIPNTVVLDAGDRFVGKCRSVGRSVGLSVCMSVCLSCQLVVISSNLWYCLYYLSRLNCLLIYVFLFVFSY